MSWDVYIKKKGPEVCECGGTVRIEAKCCYTNVCAACGRRWDSGFVDVDFNYTSNTAPMLQAAAVGTGWVKEGDYVGEVFDGMTTEALAARLGRVQAWWEARQPEMLAMNPKNGWGDFDSYRDFWRKVAAACTEYPDHVVMLSR